MRHGTLAILGVLLASSSLPGAVAIEVQDAASVSGGLVHLGDIALVEGDGAAGLRGLALCPSPLEGQSTVVSVARIRRRVAAALGSADVALSGAGSCTVTRPAAERTGGPAAAAATPAGKHGTLEALLCDYVRARLDRSPAGLRIEFDGRDSLVLALTQDQYRFRIVSSVSRIGAGNCAVRVEMLDRSQPALVARTAHIRMDVVLLEDVVVAARGIPADRVITPDDVRVERREFRAAPHLLLHEPRDVVGVTARRNIEAGSVIEPADLAKTLMVRRGDAVTVHIRGRGFSVRTVSRALEGGELGSAVAVQGKDGRGKFYATVTGARTVELRLPGAPGRGDLPEPPAAAIADTPAGTAAGKGER